MNRYFHFMMGKIFGISYIIKYLRNPNPLVTVFLLRSFGASVGDKTVIKRSIYLDNVYGDQDSCGDFSRLKIGNNCYIGDCTYFDLVNEIIIGDNAIISGRTSFVTHSDCNRSKYLSKIYPRTHQRIIIENDVWVGFGSTILQGVKIEKYSFIASSSLVNSNVENNCMYAGVPAKMIKSFATNTET